MMRLAYWLARLVADLAFDVRRIAWDSFSAQPRIEPHPRLRPSLPKSAISPIH